MYVCIYVCMYVGMCVCMDGWMDGWMDGCSVVQPLPRYVPAFLTEGTEKVLSLQLCAPCAFYGNCCEDLNMSISLYFLRV